MTSNAAADGCRRAGGRAASFRFSARRTRVRDGTVSPVPRAHAPGYSPSPMLMPGGCAKSSGHSQSSSLSPPPRGARPHTLSTIAPHTSRALREPPAAVTSRRVSVIAARRATRSSRRAPVRATASTTPAAGAPLGRRLTTPSTTNASSPPSRPSNAAGRSWSALSNVAPLRLSHYCYLYINVFTLSLYIGVNWSECLSIKRSFWSWMAHAVVDVARHCRLP
jgi:hypothetical protein